MKEDNVIVDKSKAFAVRIIRLYQHLSSDKKEFVLSKQVLRSGTSIGANVKEASRAQSKADFISKMQIALKEASETEYWIELLQETGALVDRLLMGIDLPDIAKLRTGLDQQVMVHLDAYAANDAEVPLQRKISARLADIYPKRTSYLPWSVKG